MSIELAPMILLDYYNNTGYSRNFDKWKRGNKFDLTIIHQLVSVIKDHVLSQLDSIHESLWATTRQEIATLLILSVFNLNKSISNIYKNMAVTILSPSCNLQPFHGLN